MDGKTIQRKLVGSDDQRAVSPVIGVILMVAITVILAAVIAAFVLDMGSSVQQEAQGAANIDVDEDAEQITIEVTSLNNADQMDIGGIDDSSDFEHPDGTSLSSSDLEGMGVGDTLTLNSTSADNTGTITAVAVLNPGESDEVRTTVASADFDLDAAP